MAYCDSTDVGVELRKVFNTTDAPTIIDVDQICSEVASEIDGVLVKAGYEVPISDASFLTFLKGANRLGAAARVESLIFGDARPGESVRSERLFTWYQAKLKQITSEAIGSVADFKTGDHRLPRSYQQENPSADGVAPKFTRNMKF